MRLRREKQTLNFQINGHLSWSPSEVTVDMKTCEELEISIHQQVVYLIIKIYVVKVRNYECVLSDCTPHTLGHRVFKSTNFTTFTNITFHVNLASIFMQYCEHTEYKKAVLVCDSCSLTKMYPSQPRTC